MGSDNGPYVCRVPGIGPNNRLICISEPLYHARMITRQLQLSKLLLNYISRMNNHWISAFQFLTSFVNCSGLCIGNRYSVFSKSHNRPAAVTLLVGQRNSDPCRLTLVPPTCWLGVLTPLWGRTYFSFTNEPQWSRLITSCIRNESWLPGCQSGSTDQHTSNWNIVHVFPVPAARTLATPVPAAWTQVSRATS